MNMNKNKETKYKKTYNLPLTIISIIITIILLILLIIGFIKIYNISTTDKASIVDENSKLVLLSIISFLIIFILSGILGAIIGIIRGKRLISKENKLLDKINPYIYYHELPNSFGIGVTTLLFDSTIENYKDIVAVILDLCARKYLHLEKIADKYFIKVLKGIDDNLLNNEKYILNLIINKDIKNINYKEWFNYCLQDGISLGLYYHTESKIKSKPLINKNNKNKSPFILSAILTLLFSIAIFIFYLYTTTFMQAFSYSVISFATIYLIFLILYFFWNLFTIIINIGKQTSHINYQNALNNKLTRTEKGIDEFQKLLSFKAFINDFGSFVNKKPEEVIIWDRYLSYAQVFGLTEEILKSGYKEIIENASFKIDNIENINLDKIEIE